MDQTPTQYSLLFNDCSFFPPTSLLSIFDIRATAESAKPSAMEENPPTTDKDEKHTTATDGSDGETSAARSNLVAAAIWQNMTKRTRNICHQSHKFFYLKI